MMWLDKRYKTENEKKNMMSTRNKTNSNFRYLRSSSHSFEAAGKHYKIYLPRRAEDETLGTYVLLSIE
jgi:hypothetical protein